MNDSSDPTRQPELLFQRRVRLAGKQHKELDAVFAIRIWRLPRGTPEGMPGWLSSFSVEYDFRGQHSTSFSGMDDLDALEKCAAHANDFLVALSGSGSYDIWIGENPEYPFDPSKSLVVFRSGNP